MYEYLIIILVANILYLGKGKTLQLPSMEESSCSVPEYPIPGVELAVSGVVQDMIVVCGGE